MTNIYTIKRKKHHSLDQTFLLTPPVTNKPDSNWQNIITHTQITHKPAHPFTSFHSALLSLHTWSKLFLLLTVNQNHTQHRHGRWPLVSPFWEHVVKIYSWLQDRWTKAADKNTAHARSTQCATATWNSNFCIFLLFFVGAEHSIESVYSEKDLRMQKLMG